ncbi:MAG TPA: hypothetical protein VM076_00725 [Gemmatimonadaceae bacterium]|nr:hypothetical protein [Gemmatimonadaceae bacterium]
MHLRLHARSGRAFTAVVLAVVALSACAKKDNESSGDVTPGAASPAPSTATVSVADVDVGRGITNMRVADKTNDFKAADTVYASVHTTGSASAATVMARWTFEDGQVVQESSQSIAPTGDAYTEFHISKPGGLPKGKYKVEVFLDNKSTGSKDFEVK